jgi:UTP--glucose-1-phosphate uridylyltransferase
MRVVIPAAGKGTRFLPMTTAMPKEMLPVLSRPIIEYVVQEAIAAGARDILIITGTTKRAIEDHFDRRPPAGARIHYTGQAEARGLGDAVLLAESFMDGEPFGVLLGDTIHESRVPVLTQLRKATVRGAPCFAVEEVPEEKVSAYGIVDGRRVAPNLVQCTQLLEKPDPKETPARLGLTGAYYLNRDIFDTLKATPPGRHGEIQLTDALGALAREQAVYAVQFEGTRYDIGDPPGWLAANVEFAYRDPVLREKLKGAMERWARME